MINLNTGSQTYDQFIEQLSQLENSSVKKCDISKLEAFFLNNKEHLIDKKEIALHLDSIAGKIRKISGGDQLLVKLRELSIKLLPSDTEHIKSTIDYLKESNSNKTIADWINLNQIPLAALGLTDKEIENIFPLLEYIDLTGLNY